MAKIYVGPIEIADAGTDADQDIFLLATGASEKAVPLGFELYSNAVAASAVTWEVVERSSAGTGGTAVTEEDKDRSQDATATVAMTTDVETPGTETAVMERGIWEQLGPLAYRPTPEERTTVDVSSFWGLHTLDSFANAELAGWATWKEP